jgi:hypothetical protein
MQQGMITRTAPKPNTGDFEILKASSTVWRRRVHRPLGRWAPRGERRESPARLLVLNRNADLAEKSFTTTGTGGV